MFEIWVSYFAAVRSRLMIRIVERVVQHLVEPPPIDPSECLRVFIVFSGMAGAWRSVKELDGRFFGGRKLVSLSLLPSVEGEADSSAQRTLTKQGSMLAIEMARRSSIYACSIHTWYTYSHYHLH